MNRTVFYNAIRSSVFNGRLSDAQFQGIEAILDEYFANFAPDSETTSTRWLAYILATAKHETAHTMQPIREYGRGRGRKYGRPDPKTGHVYYGRGLVQLTWAENYKKQSEKYGVDFYNNPDLVMDPKYAAKILIGGMIDGDFNGKGHGLGHYLNSSKQDYRSARRTVNILDHADMIAATARQFETAIASAMQTRSEAPARREDVTTGKPAGQSTTIWSTIGAFATTLIAALQGLETYVAIAVIVVAAGFAAWIIRERMKKKTEHGI